MVGRPETTPEHYGPRVIDALATFWGLHCHPAGSGKREGGVYRRDFQAAVLTAWVAASSARNFAS